MKLTSFLMTLPVALLLAAGGTEANEKSKAEKSESNQKTTEKEMKRSTEGHRPQDLNGDGVITRNEWPGNDVSFRELDSDGDGALTKRDRGYGAQGGEKSMYDRPVNDNPPPKKK
jgi:EF hand